MKTLYCILAILLCGMAAHCDVDPRTAALDGQKGLDKPISLNLRAASIRAVLDKVQTETGVRLRPDRDIAEDKATIFAKDKPARDILRALAHCFNLCWAESEVGSSRFLSLYMDRDSTAKMRQRHYDDYLAAAKQFDTELQAAATYIRAGTVFEVPQYTQGQNLDEYWRLQQRQAATQESHRAAMVLQYLNLSEPQRKDLFEGKEVTVEAGAIVEEAKKRYPEVTSITFWIERSLNGYLLQGTVQPALQPKDWFLLTMAMFDDARYDKVVQTANEALLKDTALAKDLPGPKTAEKPTTATTPPQDPLQLTKVPKPGEGSGATPTTMSDGILPIAETLGIPVVAQYISEYQPANPTQPKASERLAQLCTMHKFTIEREGDFLLVKAMLWHRMRDREVPEEKIRRWQQASTGMPLPPFDVQVEMGSLSWGQVRGIISNGRYWLGALDLSALARCEYALKLYNSLNPTQKRAWGEGTKIVVASLRPEQQAMFMQAFEMKARPTYAAATDASWPQTAQFSMQDAGLGGIFLMAIAQMRTLGTSNLMNSIPQELRDQISAMSQEELYAYQLSHRKDAEEVVAAAVKALLDKVAGEHPEIPRKSIGIYSLRACVFQMGLGQHNDTSYLAYCAKEL